MAAVTTRETEEAVEVLLDGDVIHEARNAVEAQAMAQWITFQVDRGTSTADLERMLRGEAPKKATGYSGGLVIGGEDEQDEPPEKKTKKSSKKAKKPDKAADEPDLSILDNRVTKVKKIVESGQCDGWLDALQKAEEDGKGRKTVLGAIEARRTEIG